MDFRMHGATITITGINSDVNVESLDLRTL
jgi:hypothetical protein